MMAWSREKRLPKPKGNKWKGCQFVHMVLQDEIPKVGSGHRWVWAKTGLKWVYIHDPYRDVKLRLSKKIYSTIKKVNDT